MYWVPIICPIYYFWSLKEIKERYLKARYNQFMDDRTKSQKGQMTYPWTHRSQLENHRTRTIDIFPIFQYISELSVGLDAIVLMLRIWKLVWPPEIRDCVLIFNPNACNQNGFPPCSTRLWNPGLKKMQTQVELSPVDVLDSVQRNRTHHSSILCYFF